MGQLRDLLSSDGPDIKAVEEYLNSLGSEERVREVRTLERAHQKLLYDTAEGHKPISLDHIVAKQQPAMSEVVHYGKNSLGAFTHFAKVFVRSEDAANGELWGYNRGSGFVETVVGPGYFVTYPHEVDGELLVDYLRVPPSKPDHWPKILSNSARLSMFVYNGTQDILRGVSEHVSIGRATRRGKPMSAWFVLCREDVS